MPAGDIFTTEIVAPTDIVIIHGRTALPEQCAIRVTGAVIAGTPVILKTIAVMTEIPVPLTLVMEMVIVRTLTNVRLLVLVIGTDTILIILITPVVFAHMVTHSVVIRITNIVIPMVPVIVQVVAYIIVASVIIAPSITVPAVQIMESIFSAVPQVGTIPPLIGHNITIIISVIQDRVTDIDFIIKNKNC